MLDPGLISAASDKLSSMSPLNFVGPIMQLFLAHKQKKLAAQINPERTMYQTSPFALENKSLAQNAYNGRMAGAAQAEGNIAAQQANAIANMSRNASSGSQLLALAAGAQGQTDNAYANLAGQEAQNKQAMLGDVMNANQGLINENDKVFQDKLMRYNEQSDAKNALISSRLQNMFGGLTGIANTLNGQKQQATQGMMQMMPYLQQMQAGKTQMPPPSLPVGFNPFQHPTVNNLFGNG